LNKIIWVPLEQIDTRYTKLSRIWFTEELKKQNVPYIIIEGKELSKVIGNKSSFLNTYSTIHYKSSQIMKIAQLFNDGKIKNGDVFMIDDIWMPGIEGIRYMAGMTGIEVKICGIYHAGGNISSDDVATKLNKKWTKPYERALFEMCDKVFVGSSFHKYSIEKYHRKKFNNLISTGIWFNSKYILNQVKKVKTWKEKEDIVLFPHRIHPEKKPELFDKIAKAYKKKYPLAPTQFIKSIESGLSKKELYELMNSSKLTFSAALQENFGYAILEASTFNNFLLLPNRVVYPEFYSKECIYEKEDIELFVEIIHNTMIYKEKPKKEKIINWADKSCKRIINHLKEMI